MPERKTASYKLKPKQIYSQEYRTWRSAARAGDEPAMKRAHRAHQLRLGAREAGDGSLIRPPHFPIATR